MRKKNNIGKRTALLLILAFAITFVSAKISLANTGETTERNRTPESAKRANLERKAFKGFSSLSHYSNRSIKRLNSYVSARKAPLVFFSHRGHTLGYEDGPISSRVEEVNLNEVSPMMARMLFRSVIASIRPLEAVRETVEPITKPLAFHRNPNGVISSSYFGNKTGISADAERMFALSVLYTPTNKLSVLMDFFEVVNIAYFKGNQLHVNYMAPDAPYNIGVFEKDLDKFFVEFGYNF